MKKLYGRFIDHHKEKDRMNFENFTFKAQESIQKAMDVATGKGHQSVECGHLMKGIIAEAESIVSFITEKEGVSFVTLNQAVDRLIESYPRVSGGCLLYTSPSPR